METSAEINPLDKLKANQQKFVIEYLDCLNAAEAARRAGYSVKTARQQGQRLLTNVDIAAAVSFLGEQMGMSSGEAIKHFADIARTRINKFLKVIKVLRTPTVRKTLQQVINELQAEIDFEEEVARASDYDKNEMKRHKLEQRSRERQLIRYTVELERNPKAYRDAPGESEWVDEVRFDLVALAKAESEGRLKSYSFTEFGPKVEFESASNALDKILQLHGRYKQVPGDLGNDASKTMYELPDGTKLIF